jgi:hypothetical protein
MVVSIHLYGTVQEDLYDWLIETGRHELAYRYCKQNNIKQRE